MSKGKLYLIPSTISEDSSDLIGPEVAAVAQGLKLFFVEHERTARRYLKSIGYQDLDTPELIRLDKRSEDSEVADMIALVAQGRDAGVLSEAGSPGVADPGAKIVAAAHGQGIKVVPLPGPSSILLAIIASGFNGQDFTFNGYLPIEERLRVQALKALEAKVSKTGQTQIFMETPYRNNKFLETILSTCLPETTLCIAANITSKKEYIRTMRISEWKKERPQLDKQPAVFLFGKIF